MPTTPPRVIALGETMIMLGPPGHELLEHTPIFRALIGGSEANVAVGLERLGVHAGWIGKLPRNALGRWVVNGTRRYGVDTSGVVWADEGRVGTFFVEFGAKPRPTKTIYDRAGSAATTLEADDLNWDYIAQAEWLHLTGITPATSETCRQSVPEIARRARELGLKVSFDLNYRSTLWSPDEARDAWLDILPHVNLLITTEADAGILLSDSPPPVADAPTTFVGAHRTAVRGGGARPAHQDSDADVLSVVETGRRAVSSAHGGQCPQREATLRCLYDLYHSDAVVMTCRGDGSAAFDGTDVLTYHSWPLEPINRLGAGDAFAAGLLYGVITADLQTGLAYGNAMSVLKYTVPQNLPLIDRADVEVLIAGRDGRSLVR